MKILFVCTGNICRSPTAEAVFRHYAQIANKGLDFYIDSAGTHSYHVGEPPDTRAIQVAQKRGISMKGLKARKVMPKDFDEFDYIFAMDQGHYALLDKMRPKQAKAQLRLFMDLCPSSQIKDVPDPYYGSHQDFENVLDIVEAGTREYFKML